MESTGPRCYVLTPFTSRASEDRRIIVQGVDLPRRHSIVACMGVLVSIFPTLVLWNLLGASAIILPVLFGLGALVLDSRTSSGMKSRRGVAILDGKRSNTGRFLVCGRPIEPNASRPVHLRQSTVPVDQPSPEEALESVFAFEGNALARSR